MKEIGGSPNQGSRGLETRRRNFPAISLAMHNHPSAEVQDGPSHISSVPLFSPRKYPCLYYLFNTHVGHTCYVLGTVLGLRDPGASKAGKALPSGAYILIAGWGVIEIKTICKQNMSYVNKCSGGK